MGTERTRSIERRAARDKLPASERTKLDTLNSCLGCDGEGLRGHTTSDGRYRLIECPWCFGTRMIDARMLRNFIRYRRILRANQDKGRCKLDASPGMRGGSTNGSAA